MAIGAEHPSTTPSASDLSVLYEYATQTLRKKADEDYIAARALFSLQHYENYVYHIAQALEKYYKSILLIKGQDTKGINHNICEAYNRISQFISFEDLYCERELKLISDLKRFQYNRYSETVVDINIDIAIPEIDCLIWKTRFFCASPEYLHNSTIVRLVSTEPAAINDVLIQTIRGRPQIIGGYLEEVLVRNESDAELCALIGWNNYYCSRLGMISIFKDANNIHISNTEYLSDESKMAILKRYVKF